MVELLEVTLPPKVRRDEGYNQAERHIKGHEGQEDHKWPCKS